MARSSVSRSSVRGVPIGVLFVIGYVVNLNVGFAEGWPDGLQTVGIPAAIFAYGFASSRAAHLGVSSKGW